MPTSAQALDLWLSAVPDAVVLVPPSGVIKYANPAAHQMFAPSGESLVGVEVERLMPQDARSGHVEHRLSFHDGDVPGMQRRQVRGSTLGGDTLQVEVHVGRGPEGTALAVVRDVSDRLRMIRTTRVQLAALSATDDAVLICDARGTIEYVNAAFTKLTGFTYDDAVGSTPRMMKSDWHGPAFYQSMWAKVAAGGVWKGEVVNRRKDGRLYTEEQSITPVMDELGKITHFIAIKHDVSERVAAQLELETDLRSVKLLQDISAIGLRDQPTLESVTSRAAGLIQRQLGLSEILLAVADDDGLTRATRLVAAEPELTVAAHESSPHELLAQLEASHAFAVGIRSGRELHGCLAARWHRQNESDKPILRAVAGHLGTMIRQIKLQSEIRHLAETDALTGLANRRQLFLRGEEEAGRARRYGRDLSVLLCDLDHFKEVNDTYGHSAGDALLREIAAELNANARDSDVVARYGGEEFVLVLVETDRDGASVVARRVLDKIAGRTAVVDGVSIGVTTSIGVATFDGPDDSLGQMLKRADKALYAAKRAGRNRVEVAE